MWFKFAKLFFVVNTSVQAATSLIASNDPNVVNYDITKEMVKHVKYHSFDDWATIPWNSAYFDVDQPDLKLVSGEFIGNQGTYVCSYYSDTVGVPSQEINMGSGVYTFNRKQLDEFSRIMFNHNYVAEKNTNRLNFVNNDRRVINFQTQLNFEIDKPLSFYIQGFMFYFEYEYFKTFTANFVFSFLDNVGDTKYVFKGKVDNDIYQQDLYNFVTIPIRVPNLRHLTVFFDVHGDSFSHMSPRLNFGQINIFSSEKVTPVPPNSPFNPQYERVSWYDVFGHLRNAFRWVLYGVVGKVLPVEPLRQFFTKLDGLLRRIFDDTISSVLNVDFTSGLEQVLTLWVFLKAVGFLVG
ncbi:hypothetical protein [Spiroplasma endosymbiont of Danaus chrysippus]|uniref:hypothetical protein n=1 Tax=Spiroplasma endosymbiont of Danaus chrysippus TaxID=2691041 RepID=UPI0013C776FF|nr:hypothetical protein [Spiroplasma endosymbiont of Danaus chrysippus]CAB1054412.1 hypothetical protein [Spiroplasma endosymbiont of Danaus chrysippus]